MVMAEGLWQGLAFGYFCVVKSVSEQAVLIEKLEQAQAALDLLFCELGLDHSGRIDASGNGWPMGIA